MTPTLDGFCQELRGGRRPAPPSMARAFVRFFGLSLRPTMAELMDVLKRAGVESISKASLPSGIRGFHYCLDGGPYSINYLEGDWEGAQEHSILHETYEIVQELLGYLRPGRVPPKWVCREADRFAASVLMQPEVFASYAEASGLDIVALQQVYGLSYASVTMRLAEVMRKQPLMAVLYAREERGEPWTWTDRPALSRFSAQVVARTPGFGVRYSSVLCGSRSGMPLWGRGPSPGSLAERVVSTGRAAYAEEEPVLVDARMGDIAVSAKPVMWCGKLAKVALVAVPYVHRDLLAMGPNATEQGHAGDCACWDEARSGTGRTNNNRRRGRRHWPDGDGGQREPAQFRWADALGVRVSGDQPG